MNNTSPFLLHGAIKFKSPGVINRVVERGVEIATQLTRLHKMYTELPVTDNSKDFLQATLKTLGVNYSFKENEISNIPVQGSGVIVANHPFGGLEGVIMADLLLSIRPDVKIIANQFLSRITNISDLFIEVDPFGGKDAIKRNHKSVKQAYQWVKDGGLLVVFPAGEVSHLQLRKRMITDPEWKSLIARIVQREKAPVIPIRFQGNNSKLFQLAGLIHPRLRTLMLPREMLNKRQTTINLRVGEAIGYKSMEKMTNEEIVRYLRLQTYLLGTEKTKELSSAQGNQAGQINLTAWNLPVASEQSAGLLQKQINTLPADQLLVKTGAMYVYIAEADQIPSVIQEIGRLRELTFRAVGEGTGKAVDLDLYDNYYQHLFIWDKEARMIVGSYRLGKTDEITKKYGKKGLYSHSLFKLKNNFINKISPALELGRSFVREEYQKSYLPLMLLWKGIGQFVVKNPDHHILFGAVSISDDYAPVSQQVLIDFLNANRFDHDLARDVKPRKKFKYKGDRHWQGSGYTEIDDLEQLSNLIMRVEGDQRGIPILLKQYLKLGGHLLGFNVDDQFNNVLDGLIVVDLREADPKALGRYMGKKEMQEFIAYHDKDGEQQATCSLLL